MRAGKLRHMLRIYPVSTGRDALGGVTQTPGAYEDIAGSFAPVSANERFDQARFAIRPTHRACIRGPLAPAQHRGRLEFDGRSFDIVEIHDPSERQDGRELELLCVARAPGPVTRA